MTTEPSTLLTQLRAPNGQWVDVGMLYHANETCWFETVSEYWEQVPHLVLGQVFEENGPGWRPSARVRLPRWFSHLLPEGRLRRVIAAAAQVKEEREFFLLARIGGDDLPGALRVSPVDHAVETRLDESQNEELEDNGLGPFKFSLAGVQLKFSVQFDERGLTIPTRGQAGDWIAKLPDPRAGYEGVPEAEFAGLQLARASGINVPEARLVAIAEISGLPSWVGSSSGQALLIQRFDRKESGGRVHIEELAQVLDIPTGHERFKYQRANYETVARTTAALCGPQVVAEVIDRLVLNVLVGNGDAHLKNWAYR